MTEADAAAVLAIQQAAYPLAHHESWAVLGRKLALWPQGCWVLTNESDTPRAYLFSHPGRADAPPPLHGVIDALPASPNAYALHDLALHPSEQGRGLGQRLWLQALAQALAAELPQLSLVAVQGSAGFWERQGFKAAAPASGASVQELDAYGGDAVFMLRAVS